MLGVLARRRPLRLRLAAPANPRVSAGVPAADDPDPRDHLQPDHLPAAVARVAVRRGGADDRAAFPCCAKATSSALANTRSRSPRRAAGSARSSRCSRSPSSTATSRTAAAGRAITLALASIPVAIIANGFRVAGTGILAHYVGPKAAEGFFHEFSGWLVFVVAFVMLFAVQRLIALGRAGPNAPRRRRRSAFARRASAGQARIRRRLARDRRVARARRRRGGHRPRVEERGSRRPASRWPPSRWTSPSGRGGRPTGSTRRS